MPLFLYTVELQEEIKIAMRLAKHGGGGGRGGGGGGRGSSSPAARGVRQAGGGGGGGNAGGGCGGAMPVSRGFLVHQQKRWGRDRETWKEREKETEREKRKEKKAMEVLLPIFSRRRKIFESIKHSNFT